MPTITLPDGHQRVFDHPVSVRDVAAAIGPGLAKAALAGKVDGRLVDASHVLNQDANLAIITNATPKGWTSSAIPAPICWPTRSSNSIRRSGHHRPSDRKRLLLRLCL